MRESSGVAAMLARQMSSQGKSWSKAEAVCPRPEHAASRVRFAGRHGPTGHRRQRYWYVPANGDRPHRFGAFATGGVLARRLRAVRARHPCPRGPARRAHVSVRRPGNRRSAGDGWRRLDVSRRGAGRAGASEAAAGWARRGATVLAARIAGDGLGGGVRAGRVRALPTGHLAGQRLAATRRSAVPSAQSEDRLHPDCVQDLRRDGNEAGRAKLWRLEAFTSKSEADWKAFLGALPGAPQRVVCDNDHGLTNAVGARFPDAELYLCEWHLRHALERPMGKLRTEDPQHREAIDELLQDVEAAFTGPAFWAAFLERAHAAGIPRASEWLNTTGQIVEEQFGRRGLRWKRSADAPLSTSSLDAFINPIRASIKPRAYGLKNRERTNRMLMLMQSHANREDDVNTYVRHIRDCLEGNQGRPSVARRAIVDAGGSASLR